MEPSESPARIGKVDDVDTTGAMRRLIEAVDDADALDGYSTRAAGTAAALLDGGADGLTTCRALTSLHDSLTGRLIELAQRELGPPPCPYAWIALGSGGRMEQSLSSDQDHALVYADGEEPAPYYAALGSRVVEGLDRAGLRPCPGGYMADRWQLSLPSWRSLFRRWVERPEPQALVEAEVFMDFRRVRGDLSLEPLDAVLRRGAGESRFLLGMARAAVGFAPPRRLVGLVRHRRGEVDLKRSGLAATVLLARLYALAAGSLARSTPDRLAAAATDGVLSSWGAAELAEAYRFLMELRLVAQLRHVAAGQVPTNGILMENLTVEEHSRLRWSLRAIQKVQRRGRAAHGVVVRQSPGAKRLAMSVPAPRKSSALEVNHVYGIMVSMDPAPVSYDIEVTVDEHLVDELVRNGVPRGRRVRMHLEVVPEVPARQGGGWASFIGMVDSGEPDLAERSEEILRQELGRR